MDMADQLITMVGEEVTTYLHGPFEYRTVVLSGSELSGTLIYKGVETNLKIISDDTLVYNWNLPLRSILMIKNSLKRLS